MSDYLCCVECNRDTTQKPIEYRNEVDEPLCEDCWLDKEDK